MKSASGVEGKRRSAVVFEAILVAASAFSFSIAMSPFIFVSHDPSALKLSASLNSTSIVRNATVGVRVSEVNGLRIPDALPLSGDWAVKTLTQGECANYGVYPFGFAVFQGAYGIRNATSAVALPLQPPGAFYSCPIALAGGASTRFAPLANITLSTSFAGYYTSGYTELPGGGTAPGVLHHFAPGEYTVVVGDEWGHAQFLHFRVGLVAVSLKDIVLCTLVCGYPLPNLSGTVRFQAPSPLRSLDVSINGTEQGVVAYDNPALTSVDLETQYDSGPPVPPVVAHDVYVIQFELAFDDGSTAKATETLVGG